MTPQLAELQRAVQHQLGGCMLRLQEYEILLKTLVAHTEIVFAEPARMQAVLDERIAAVRKTPLGDLVKLFTNNYLKSDGSTKTVWEPDTQAPRKANVYMRMQFGASMTAECFEATKAGLKELVDMRNELVHHLLQRFDLYGPEGCMAAAAHLTQCRATIERYYQSLRQWAMQHEEVRAHAASLLASEGFVEALIARHRERRRSNSQ